MIPVTCESCGTSFRARDEHAGRQGKCPSCGEAITVPAAPPADDAAPTATGARSGAGPTSASEVGGRAGAPAPRVASRSGSAGSGSSSRGRSRRGASGGAASRLRSRSGSDKGGLLVIAVLAVLAGAVGVVLLSEGGVEIDGPYTEGLDHLAAARYVEAIRAFERVERDSDLYDEARTQIDAAVALLETANQRALERSANTLYQVIAVIERDFVDRGTSDTDHASYVRYLAKRGSEFLETYPDDSRAEEVRLMLERHVPEGLLETPPTARDVRVEVAMFRLVWPRPNYAAAQEAVSAFEASGGTAEAVANLRKVMQDHADTYWQRVQEDLDERGALAPGSENWQQVANRVQEYVDAVERGGLAVSAEARGLLGRALAGG